MMKNTQTIRGTCPGPYTPSRMFPHFPGYSLCLLWVRPVHVSQDSPERQRRRAVSPRMGTPPHNQGTSHGGWVTGAMARAILELKWLIQGKPVAPSLKETPRGAVGWKVHPILCRCLPTLPPGHEKAALLGRPGGVILRHPWQKCPGPYGRGAGAHFLTPGEEKQRVRGEKKNNKKIPQSRITATHWNSSLAEDANFGRGCKLRLLTCVRSDRAHR